MQNKTKDKDQNKVDMQENFQNVSRPLKKAVSTCDKNRKTLKNKENLNLYIFVDFEYIEIKPRRTQT